MCSITNNEDEEAVTRQSDFLSKEENFFDEAAISRSPFRNKDTI